MKKFLFLLFILVSIVIGCAPKASHAVTDATIPAETRVSNDADAIRAGHTIFTTKCTQCHKQQPIEKWTYEKLRPTLAVMVKKAKLSKTEIEQVSAYVHANSKK